MWLLFAVANMLTLTALRVVQKPFADKTDMNGFRANWLMQLVSLPVLLVLLAMHAHDIAQLSATFWWILAAVVIGFYPLVNFLYFKTIQEHDLSVVLPLFGLLPIATLFAGWLCLHQTPSRSGAFGCVLVSLALYVLYFKPGMKPYEPIQNIFRSSAARAMFVISIVTALATIGDKFAINRSGTVVYSILNMTGALIILLICDAVYSRKNPATKRQSQLTRKQSIAAIVIMGILLVTTQYAGFAAIQAAPVAGYAIAIRNVSNVLASLLALVALHERANRYKMMSYGLSAVGVVLIAL